ncbi:MAG: hypothetical protein WBN11_13795 [Eudoraea sp.]|uniref:hypothetical protein n=1 Tax=Eudoraea sp. TaxID=1979955 RepID=UPI003C790124
MNKYKLIMIEQGTINNPVKDPLKLKAIQEIKRLFTKIDFNAEVVPMDNSIKLKELLISIKGTPLTKEESEIVEELVQ